MWQICTKLSVLRFLHLPLSVLCFLNNHILCSSFFFVFVALPKVIDFLFSFLDEEKILTSLENSNGSALK